ITVLCESSILRPPMIANRASGSPCGSRGDHRDPTRSMIANLRSSLRCSIFFGCPGKISYHIQPSSIHKIYAVPIWSVTGFPEQNIVVVGEAPLIALKQLGIHPVSDNIKKSEFVLQLRVTQRNRFDI